MSPTEAESAMRSHVEAEYVDRLQRENATLREALENECTFSAASREAHATAMSRIAALERELEQAREDRARAAMDARNPLLARLAALEAENKALRDRLAEEDTVKNAALNCVREATGAVMRLAPLEAEAKQAREDEAWAEDHDVVIDSEPVEKGWHAIAVVEDYPLTEIISANGPTIHAAIRSLRAKVEGGAR